MAGIYDSVKGTRMAWDTDCQGFYYLDGAGSPTNMSAGEMNDCNNEDDVTVLSLGSSPTEWSFGVVFPELRNLEAYFVSVNGAGDLDNFETSINTTDGMDGTWVSRDTTPNGGNITGVVIPDYRTGSATAAYSGIKGVRWHKASGVGRDLIAIHLYGKIAATSSKRLEFWDPYNNEPLDPTRLDFGAVAHRSSQDVIFRIKNMSDTDPAYSVQVHATDTDTVAINPVTGPQILQTIFLSSNGKDFSSELGVGTLDPRQISGLLTLRCLVPDDFEDGSWTDRIFTSNSSSHKDDHAYFYYGEVDVANLPSPHLWYLTPASARGGDTIHVYGMGIGEDDVEYSRVVKFNTVTMSETTNNFSNPGGAAYDASRQILGSYGIFNVDYQSFDFVLPAGSADGYLLVETTP